MDWLDYREKLGIGFNDDNKVKYFLTRIFNVLEEIKPSMRNQIDDKEYFSFCNMTATPMHHGPLYGEGFELILGTLQNHSKSIKDFIAYYIAFINCQNDSKYKEWTREDFKNLLCNQLFESHIPYEVIMEDENYFVFPKGAKELDDALVSEPLVWLSDYPLSRKAWIIAIKAYAISDEENASEVADKFRKALERFFQEFFESEKSLENLKSEYGNFLTEKGVPSELKNNFEKLLDAYTNYMNNYAKHHDRTSKNVLEYIMYQTGNIIRLLITLN